MAIIYPASCRNVSAGALKQLKQQGWTTAGREGGLFRPDVASEFVATLSVYFTKREPIGGYMEQLKETSKQIGELQEAIRKGMVETVAVAREQSEALTDVSRKLRDNAEKLGAAIEKFSRVAGSANFGDSAKQAESLVSSLERLAVLQQSGMLDKVMAAISRDGK